MIAAGRDLDVVLAMELFGFRLGRPLALLALLLIPLAYLLARRAGGLSGTQRPQLFLRMATIALLAFAIAEPMLVSNDAGATTVFVVDRSGSVDDRSTQSINDWIAASLAAAGVEETIAVVNFGSSPTLAGNARNGAALDDAWMSGEGVDQEATNIESALGMARALPGGAGKRIVLVSDGAENIGSALNQASQAAAEGTAFNVLPVAGAAVDNVQLTGLSMPSAVWAGQPLQTIVSVAASTAGSGTVELQIDGNEPERVETEFPINISSYSFDLADLEPGFHAITARVVPDGPDRYAENNSATSAILVRDAPKVLLVAPAGTDDALIRTALENGGVVVESRIPAEIPTRTSDLAAYDVTILLNVPASDLTIDQMTAFQEVIESMGRGLIVIGGTAAYGPGGYAGTELEKVLPVTVRVTEGKERQKVALLIIVDKSGSMANSQQTGNDKIDLAKEAIRLAGGVLIDGDEFGLLAFNDSQEWVLPLEPIEGPADRANINAAVETLKADGSTEIYSALEVGFAAFATSDADVRHVVLISDGRSGTGTRESYEKLIEDARASQITFSAIAIGDDADFELLQYLAGAGDGRFHYAASPEELPQLTMAEAQSAGSQSVLRGTFKVLQDQASPMLGEFTPEDLPVVDGYNFAEVKPNAQTILSTQRTDPLLAQWQFGLGRVVAWTADDGIDFASQWPEWESYDAFWLGVLQWTLPDPENSAVQATVERTAGDAVLTLTSSSLDSAYVNLTGAIASIFDASGALVAEAELVQIAPGEYTVHVPDAAPGAYQVIVAGPESTEPLYESAFTVPLSAELSPSPAAGQLLEQLASATGGELLTFEDPGAVFRTPVSETASIPSYRQLWQLPLALGLLAFLADLGLRYGIAARLGAFRRS